MTKRATEASFSGALSGMTCRILPSGRIVLENQAGLALESRAFDGRTKRLLEAFEANRARGLLHLSIAEIAADVSPDLAFWRELGKALISEVCVTRGPSPDLIAPLPEPDQNHLAALLQRLPPMAGAEVVDLVFLEELWRELGQTLLAQEEAFEDGLQGYFSTHGSQWNVMGRVCLHLAENKRDPDFPFAFLATYTRRMSSSAKPQHQPLGEALKEYAGARNHDRLRHLLSPLARAAEESSLIRDLLESGDVYHPLSWTAPEAYEFLCETPLYERAGLVVRIPSWWTAQRKQRPRVTVEIGDKAPAGLGASALMNFEVGVTLGGERLSPEEIEDLLASTRGLILIKGQWTEIDSERLSDVLSKWKHAQSKALAEGVSFREALRLLAGFGTGFAEEVREHGEWAEVVSGKWLSSQLAELRANNWSAEIETNAGLKLTLREYQKKGIQWLLTLQNLGLGGCLADDMGLGKTIQVLGALRLSRSRSATKGLDLLVVPASLLDNWRREIERFAPDMRVYIAHPSHSSGAELREFPEEPLRVAHLVITSYTMLARSSWIKSHSWRSLILDEAQAIKNPSSAQTRAVKSIKAGWRLALSGTPIENRLGDLWSLFDFLNPGLLGSAKGFAELCKTMAKDEQGYAPLRRLVQPYILRRLKTDRSVISDLPDKTELRTDCLLTKTQVVLYGQSVSDMINLLKKSDGIKRRGIILGFLMRFKQICNHPSQWLGDSKYDPASSGKLLRLQEIGEDIAARQEKLLVFTQFREMTEPLKATLGALFARPGLVLHGGTPVKTRAALVQKFQEDEDTPFMVLSLKAGGTGLNLTAASHVIHFDRWWNPAVESQATDRAFRIGQKRNVLVHKFVCKGTLEERIDALIESKKALSDEILSGGAETFLTELGDEELISMVGLDLKRAVEG